MLDRHGWVIERSTRARLSLVVENSETKWNEVHNITRTMMCSRLGRG